MINVVPIFDRHPDRLLAADWRFFLTHPERTCRRRLACSWEIEGSPVIMPTGVVMSLVRLWGGRLWRVSLPTTAADLCENRPDDNLRDLFDSTARCLMPVELARCPFHGRAA